MLIWLFTVREETAQCNKKTIVEKPFANFPQFLLQFS